MKLFVEFLSIAGRNPKPVSMKSVFGALDGDGDGYITGSEMSQAFDKLGQNLSEDEIHVIFKKFDVNQDGNINFEGKVL